MRIGIHKKLVFSFLVGTFFATVFIIWALVTIEGMLTTMNKMDSLTLRVEKTASLNFQIQGMLKTTSDYLVSGDIGKRDDLDLLVTEMADLLNILENEEGGKKWEEAWAKVRTQVTTLSVMATDVVYIDNPVGNSEATGKTEEISRFAQLMSAGLEEFTRVTSEERLLMAGFASKSGGRTRTVLYTFPVVGFILLIFLYISIGRFITRPIMKLSEGAEILSKGEFSHHVSVNTNDELSDLASGFNNMADVLKTREAKLTSLIKVADKINRELLSASQHKSAFLSNISHELKTPLTHILGFSELLKLEVAGKLPKSGQTYIDSICSSGNDLLKLINDLLEVTRGTPGGLAPDIDEVNIPRLIAEIVGAFNVIATDKGVTLEVDLEEEITHVRLDGELFKEMISNLLDNALKFTPRGGKAELLISFGFNKNVRVLKVIVRDTGIGIDPERIDTIFDPFEVGEKTLKRDYGGMGAGLALTKRFVEFHGGLIHVDSTLGKGSTFEFFIPLGETDIEEAKPKLVPELASSVSKGNLNKTS
ncbi:MAG: HAMP domain-containing histidine kinase [Deltaproteobacteria bacterium]|nr:HAMP domain-containing histidine kinase [Deltaproteobacteria bacterium]